MSAAADIEVALPPVDGLAAKLRLMAAVSSEPLQITMDCSYARQVAARLDRVVLLEAHLALAADRETRLRNLCTNAVLWSGFGCAGLGVLSFGALAGLW